MRLQIPTSDRHSQVKITINGPKGELSSEYLDSSHHTTVQISDADWESDDVEITSQFVGENGRPDPKAPVEFLKKRKAHETPSEETLTHEVPDQAGSASGNPPTEPSDSGGGNSEKHDTAGDAMPVSEARLEQGSGRDGLDLGRADEPAGHDLTPEPKPAPQTNWKRNKR